MARFKLADVEAENPDDEQFEVEGSDEKVYVLPHPQDLHYDDVIQLQAAAQRQDVAGMVGALLGDDLDAFTSDPRLTGRALDKVMEAWSQHYGLTDLGEANASPRSSSATARRSKPTSRGASATRKRS